MILSLQFALAVFLLIITPGPGVLSLAGIGAAYRPRVGAHYFTGLMIGNNLVFIIVSSGLAAIVLSVPIVRNILFFCSAAYLCWLALGIATQGASLAFHKTEVTPGIRTGVMLQLLNPKAYAVNTTFLAGFSLFPDALLWELLVKIAIINAIWIPIHLLWWGLGVGLRRLNLPQHITRRINMAMAASLLGVVIIALYAQFR